MVIGVCLSVCLCVCLCALCLSARYLKNGFMDHHQIWWVGAGGEPLEQVKFWCWSDSGCVSRITFPFPLTLMLATASAQVCVPLGHSSLYSQNAHNKHKLWGDIYISVTSTTNFGEPVAVPSPGIDAHKYVYYLWIFYSELARRTLADHDQRLSNKIQAADHITSNSDTECVNRLQIVRVITLMINSGWSEGARGLSPLLPFEPPCNSMSPWLNL